MVTICHGHDHVMGHEAQRTLVDMQIDSAKRDLELGIRSLRQQNHAELFQEAERVAGIGWLGDKLKMKWNELAQEHLNRFTGSFTSFIFI